MKSFVQAGLKAIVSALFSITAIIVSVPTIASDANINATCKLGEPDSEGNPQCIRYPICPVDTLCALIITKYPNGVTSYKCECLANPVTPW